MSYKLNDELSEIVQRHQQSLDDGVDQEIALTQSVLEKVLRDEKDSSELLRKTQAILPALMKMKQQSRKFRLESGKLLTVETAAFLLGRAAEVMGDVVREHTDEAAYFKCVDGFVIAWEKEFKSNPLMNALLEQDKN